MKSIVGVLVAGGMLTANAAAPTETYLAGINGKTPNRAAIVVQANTVAPVAGSTSQRTFVEVQYLETPVESGGKMAFVLAASEIVDCAKRTVGANVIVTLDDQGNMLSRGKSGEQPAVPPRGSFREIMLSAVCSGDWSKLERVPDLPVPAMRARFFTKQ